MAVKVRMDLPDFENVRSVLQGMGDTVTRGLLTTAGRLAVKPLVKEARRRAPKRTRNLAKSIGVITERGGNRYGANIVVAPRSGRRQKHDGWYAHIVEGGAKGIVKNTGKRFKKGQRYRKDIPGRPFFEPAVAATETQISKDYAENINTALERKIARLRKVRVR